MSCQKCGGEHSTMACDAGENLHKTVASNWQRELEEENRELKTELARVKAQAAAMRDICQRIVMGQRRHGWIQTNTGNNPEWCTCYHCRIYDSALVALEKGDNAGLGFVPLAEAEALAVALQDAINSADFKYVLGTLSNVERVLTAWRSAHPKPSR